MSEPLQWCFGPFQLDTATGCLWRGEDLVELTPKPAALLRHLVMHAGQVVNKDDLLDAVWPETAVSEGVLKTNMGVIRQLLGETARTPQYIATVRGRGYRFIAPVTPVAPPLAADEAPALPLARLAGQGRMIGREAEIAWLHEQFEQARQGRRRLVWLTGEPGIGKTTLADAFTSQAASDAVWVARGQCIEQYGAGEPYLPLLEALAALAKGPDGAQVIDVLYRHAPSWLLQLPALAPPDDIDKLQRLASRATPVRMLRELAEAIEALTAERALILVLEDLHWGDRSTLDWLAFAARRREPAQLLILGTYRPAEAIVQDYSIRPIARELTRQGLSAECLLAYLQEPDVAAYLAHRFGGEVEAPPGFAGLLSQRTGGNPFFLAAMVDELVHQKRLAPQNGAWRLQVSLEALSGMTPESIQHLIEDQFEQLPGPDQELVSMASVAGLSFSALSLAPADDAARDDADMRLASLARQRRFIQTREPESWPDGSVVDGYQFIHGLHQEILYHRLTLAQRVRWHRRIGERLEAGYGRKASRSPANSRTISCGAKTGREPCSICAWRRRRRCGEAPIARPSPTSRKPSGSWRMSRRRRNARKTNSASKACWGWPR